MRDSSVVPNGPALYGEELAELIKESGWQPGQPVYLFGCHTGGDTGIADMVNISQSVANSLHTDVYGADKYFFFDNGIPQVFGATIDPSGPNGYRADMNDPGTMIKFSPSY